MLFAWMATAPDKKTLRFAFMVITYAFRIIKSQGSGSFIVFPFLCFSSWKTSVTVARLWFLKKSACLG